MEGHLVPIPIVEKRIGATAIKHSPSPPLPPPDVGSVLDSIQGALESIATDIKRIATKVAPGPEREIVGARYVADALGCSTQWIGEQVRTGSIPKSCIVPGTGKGKPWKFNKAQIDKWIKTR